MIFEFHITKPYASWCFNDYVFTNAFYKHLGKTGELIGRVNKQNLYLNKRRFIARFGIEHSLLSIKEKYPQLHIFRK